MANKDFRVAVGFFRHLKTRKVKRRLGVPAAYAWLEFWAYVAENKPTGELGAMSPMDIADAADYDGDADELVACWLEVGWLDRDEQNNLHVHDWSDHNGYAAAAPERSQKARDAALVKHGKKPARRRSPATRTKAHAGSSDAHESSTAPSPSPSPSPTPSPNPTPVPSPDREGRAHTRAGTHARMRGATVAASGEAGPLAGGPTGRGSAVPTGADDVATEPVAPAGPAGLPKGAKVAIAPERLETLKGVMVGALIRPEQAPAQMRQVLEYEYPRDQWPLLHTLWRDLGPDSQAAWIAEALGRPDVKGKAVKNQWRSAARHIGTALKGGFDLLTEDRTAKVIAHPSARPAPARNVSDDAIHGFLARYGGDA